MKGKVFIALGFIFVLSQTPLIVSAATFSVPRDHPTIRSAIEAAQPGDRIELSPGIYQEYGLVMRQGIILIGMGNEPGDVVIDGGHSGRIILCEGVAKSSFIENLTLTRGHARGETSYDQSGGALLSSNSVLRISKVVFSDNVADSHGGALRCNNSDILITDCEFTGNSAPGGGGGAVDCSYGSSPLFRACDFENNTADWGGALSCRADSSPIIYDSRFRNNQAAGDLGFGGAVFSDFQAAPVFNNSTFFGNHALYGGALASFQDAETNLENCTVAGNSADISGGGLFCHDSSPRVTSSIIAFQEGTGIVAHGSSVPDISCSDLFGNSMGDWVGNIADQGWVQDNLSVDPAFCSDDPGGDPAFSLQEDSPCGPDVNPCGTIGAWPVGCAGIAIRLSFFHADWNGNLARLSWQAAANGEDPEFLLTGALESTPDQEWEIPFRNDGGGFYIGEDPLARAQSGKKYDFRLYFIDSQGERSLLGEVKLLAVPDFPDIRDLKAWPNPFNPSTSISFSLGRSQPVRVSIFTVDGRRVKVLAAGTMAAGSRVIPWDGTDDGGRRVSAGAYVALVEAGPRMQTVKLTMIK